MREAILSCGRKKSKPPTFRPSRWVSDTKVLECSDQYSLDFLTSTVNGLGQLWANAQLAVINHSQIPTRPRARLWVPAPIVPEKTLLELILLQNSGIKASDLRLVRAETVRDNGQHFVLDLGPSAVCAVTGNDGFLTFGVDALEVKYFSKGRFKGEVDGATDSSHA